MNPSTPPPTFSKPGKFNYEKQILFLSLQKILFPLTLTTLESLKSFKVAVRSIKNVAVMCQSNKYLLPSLHLYIQNMFLHFFPRGELGVFVIAN